MSFLLPFTYPGLGVASGVQTITPGPGIGAILDLTTFDATVSNIGALNIQGNGEAIVTSSGPGDFNVDVDGTVTTLNGLTTTTIVGNGTTLLVDNAGPSNVISIDFPVSESAVTVTSYSGSGSNPYLINGTSVNSYTGTNFISYKLQFGSGFTYTTGAYALWLVGSSSLNFVRKTVPITIVPASGDNFWHSGSFTFDAGATPRFVIFQIQLYNTANQTGPPVIGSVYSVKLD
jgi:hypothetical protein